LKKTFSFLLLVALLALSVPAFAGGNGSDYFIWIGLGPNYSFQPEINRAFVDNGIPRTIQYNPAVGGSVEVGFKFDLPNFGVRARCDFYSGTTNFTTTFTQNQQLVVSPGSANGYLLTGYAQVLGFIPVNDVADCYLGVGVGGLQQSANVGASTIGNFTVPGYDVVSTCAGLPVSLGGNYFFCDDLAVNVDLTYMISTDTANIASYFTPLLGLKYTF